MDNDGWIALDGLGGILAFLPFSLFSILFLPPPLSLIHIHTHTYLLSIIIIISLTFCFWTLTLIEYVAPSGIRDCLQFFFSFFLFFFFPRKATGGFPFPFSIVSPFLHGTEREWGEGRRLEGCERVRSRETWHAMFDNEWYGIPWGIWMDDHTACVNECASGTTGAWYGIG
ncbi:hypothetical protein VTK26DRAFT_3795 [Humicola hyalothermophila]